MNKKQEANNGTIYKCTLPCPIHKRCFIIKTVEPIQDVITVLYKCQAQKADIRLCIGGERSP